MLCNKSFKTVKQCSLTDLLDILFKFKMVEIRDLRIRKFNSSFRYQGIIESDNESQGGGRDIKSS